MTAAEKRWQVHVAGWTRSGLSCKEYAVQVGVHPGTLAAWKSKLRRAQATAPTFVEVTEQLAIAAEPDAGELELVVGRTLLRVRGRVEAEALTRVLDVLEARA
jgi:transposase-like protein